MIDKLLLTFSAAYTAVNLSVAAATHIQVQLPEAEPPPDTVSIVMPAWHEETETVIESILSLKTQSVVEKYPEYFETILVGCEGIDVQALTPYFDKVLCAPFGKLTARHVGIQASWGNIIAAVDSDTIYPKGWLNMMLKPFRNPSVVAATSRTSPPSLLDPLLHLPRNLYFTRKMLGRGSLFRREAYFKVGGFNLNINQADWRMVEAEEEYNFKRKLEKIGKVVFVDAPHYTVFRPSTPARIGLVKKHKPS
jgi:glycosyltransferase involved in cell wall biosynthesis